MATLSPSAYMRRLRPENYSDTEERAGYVLDQAVFEYQLETITARNQTQDFEIFCRKLCERAICGNLRPHTGPDGGGDSKADTETFPISDEMATRSYVGEVRDGTERWAFAFSAMEDWRAKVRSDVAGIVGTGRPYGRIIFVTSRFAKDKARADLEQALTQEHGVPVTIHDRSWIVQEVIDRDRKDLAFNYLKVGQEVSDSLRLGPSDYSRTRQLDDIEKSLSDPSAFQGMRRQEVTEALLAAKLSRGIERPRAETEGRFSRAVRLADAHGSARQKLETRYEALWTAVWWFDDFELINREYEAFEARVIDDDSVKNLEFLSNLLQMLFNAVIHDVFTPEACDLKARADRLYARFDALAEDRSRPNNALQARTLRLIGRLNVGLVDGDEAVPPDVWTEFSNVIQSADGLGEYDAESLQKLIEAVGPSAGADPAYGALVEELATFVATRKGEAEGALILLRRAKALDLDHHFEIIRLLGKAARQLTKKEYAGALIQALQHLAIAYKSAGLLWSARATFIFAAATIAIEGEADSEVDIAIIPTLETLAWTALELRLLPDLLEAIQLLNGALGTIPLSDQSKDRLRDKLQTLDYALASCILNFKPDDLEVLERIPDVLGGLGLATSRTATLYALGYEAELRGDGWIPQSESAQDVQDLFTGLASQPVSKDIQGPLISHLPGEHRIEATVLGMVVGIACDGDATSIVLAEAVAAAIEAAFATAWEVDVLPHTERFEIRLCLDESASEPKVEVNEDRLEARLIWPKVQDPFAYTGSSSINQFLGEVAFKTMAATSVMGDMAATIERLAEGEALFDRIAMIAITGNSYTRLFGQGLTRLSNWDEHVTTVYPLRAKRPAIRRIDLPGTPEPAAEPVVKPRVATEADPPRATVQSHRDATVLSVIDMHLWNKAGWSGANYGELGPGMPPCLGLAFKNEAAARAIFERWRERFGQIDRNDDIYLSVVRDVSKIHPHHYSLLVTSNWERKPPRNGGPAMVLTRFQRMHAETSVNLQRFLKRYDDMGVYLLMPAVMEAGGPRFLKDCAILKRNLALKSANTLGAHEVERIVVSETANEHFGSPGQAGSKTRRS